MRDRVTIKLGGQEYNLLPTFKVVENFEDRNGGLMAHLVSILDASATLARRAFLLHEALKADYEDRGEASTGMTVDAMKVSIYEAGFWSDGVIAVEQELIERLLFTPEQYLAKKTRREAEARTVMDHLSALSPSLDMPAQS